MIDGKITCILGCREQGKTLLNYTFYKTAKLPSYYVTVRHEHCFSESDVICHNIDDFLKTKSDKYIFIFNDRNDYEIFFRAIRKEHNCNLFIDEASVWMSGYSVAEFMSDLIVFTRPQNINIFFTSIRPQLLSPLALSQSNLLIAFNIHNLRDIDYLEKSYGADFVPCRKLEKFNFYWYGEIDFLNEI
jgi:hypothetical protein